MDYWNAAEAEIKKPYPFVHPNGNNYTLLIGTPVLLHRSQAPFRKPRDKREWVTITPLTVQKYYAKGAQRGARTPMFQGGSHPRIVIPAIHIRMKDEHLPKRGYSRVGPVHNASIRFCRTPLSKTDSPGIRALGGGFSHSSLIRPVWYSARTRTEVELKVMNAFSMSGMGLVPAKTRSPNRGISLSLSEAYF
ncbi:hypothetical protein LX36DRAFT_429506 [Colletotrichum falcatum]|nr:hypothetical protein LX36DRAFT_429506 [Colletotrichum falcatum]